MNKAKFCGYCNSPISDGQRWVRETLYKPCVTGRATSDRHYHAEALTGEGLSCWEKNQTKQEIARTAARNEQSAQVAVER
jgi:hypothetical protein